MEKFATPAVRSVAEQVQKTLIRAIVDGSLPPNERLSDRQLSEQLGVSRTPIRDAFHHLEAAGLVRRRSRIGWLVADLNQRDVEELFELRAVLEAAGVRRVVEWPEEDLAELASSFSDFQVPLDDESTTAYLKHDNEFHKALVEGTENSRIIEMYRVVEWQIDRVRHFVSYRAQGRITQSLAEHKSILAALEQRNATEATEALNRHLSNVQNRFVELMQGSDVPTDTSSKGGGPVS